MSETPLHCFPMRIDWEATLPILAAEPFPAPVRTSRELDNAPRPAPVMKLAEFAREHSWEVWTQYSQGYVPHAITGRPGALKALIGLRFGAHPMTDRQAYAVYSRNASSGTWTWTSVAIWGPDLSPYLGCGITELKEYLREPDIPVVPLLAWVAMIEKGRAEHAALVKARPKTPPKPREDHA